MPRRAWPRLTEEIMIRGRAFTQADLAMIRRLIRQHKGWGRTRVSEHVARDLLWFQANGRPKERACRVALLRLQERGYLRLPKRLKNTGGRPPVPLPLELLLPEPPSALSAMPSTIEVRLAVEPPETRLWNAVVSRHHYLGLTTPVGRLLRYLLLGDGQLLGAVSFTDCAWAIAARRSALTAVKLDEREAHNRVIGNNRFLILPHAHIPNLASRLLSLSTRKARDDWQERYGTTPVLAETFVDPTRFYGACYRAANWFVVGKSKGFAKRGGLHIDRRAEKLYLVRGLDSVAQRRLESAFAKGNAWEWIAKSSTPSHQPPSRAAA